MISTKSLLILTRPEVLEVRLESGKRPAARAGDGLAEIDPEPLSSDDILQFLFHVGGSRYVDGLGPKPTQWRTRIDALGAISVTATKREDSVEVLIARSEKPPAPLGAPENPAPPAAALPAVAAVPPPAPSPTPAPGARESTLGELFHAAIALAHSHFLTLFASAALALVPAMALAGALGRLLDGSLGQAASVVSVAALLLVEAPLTLACVRALGMTGEPPGLSPSGIYLATGERLGTLAAVVVLSRVAPVPLFLLLVGAFLYMRFCVAVPAAIAEDIGPVAALRRSYELTGRAIVETICALVASAAAAAVVGGVGGAASLIMVIMTVVTSLPIALPVRATVAVAGAAAAAAAAVLWSAALPFFAALSAVLYREMRVREALAAPAEGRPPTGGPFRRAGPFDPLAGIAPWPLHPDAAAVAPARAHLGRGAFRRRAGQILLAVFAVGAAFGAYWGIGRYRFERALRRVSLCVAYGDQECARAVLDTARSVDEEDVRLRIAEADVTLLAGARRPAQTLLATMVPEQEDYDLRGARRPMTRAVRADLMILRGDLALSRRRMEEGRQDLEAARLLVSEAELVDARLERAGFPRATPGATPSAPAPSASNRPAQPIDGAKIVELKKDIRRLLELAPGRETPDATLLAASLDERVSALPYGAERSRLRLTLDAIGDVIQQAKYNAKMAEADQAPQPPKPPSRDDIPKWARTPNSIERERQRLWQQYEVALVRYNEAKDRLSEVMVKDGQKLDFKLQQAHKSVEETFALLDGREP